MAKQLIVIGGGAAGFFSAIHAAKAAPGLRVILLEKSSKLLSKVKVSGGGRCNLTHDCRDIALMSRQYPRGENFVKRAFHHFFTTDTINWFEDRGVKVKTEPDGRMFPVSNSSQTIIDCLLKAANEYGVVVQLNSEVSGLEKIADQWQVQLKGSEAIIAAYVCIACGGFPKAAMFDWISKLGHHIIDPLPSLFTFNMPDHPIRKLMGVSVESARIKIKGSRLEESGPLLITHWGMSGPCVLRMSAWGARELAAANYEFIALVNWLPAISEQALRDEFSQLRRSKASLKIGSRNPFDLPNRLWSYFLQHDGIDEEGRWADLSAKHQNQLVKQLVAGEFPVKGKTTFKEEFVTAGGVDLREVSASTMMSKKVSGLYFAGEILDVDGITGGYNFQHAWTSGFIAGKAIGEQSQVDPAGA